jgi:hypothetical protein
MRWVRKDLLWIEAVTVGNPNLKIQMPVRQPETVHEVRNPCLSAWPARAAKLPKERAL